MDNQLIEKLKRYIFADSFKKGESWKGYNVYIPIYNKQVDVGLPYFVLEKDGEMRKCNDVECFDYIIYLKKKEKENGND